MINTCECVDVHRAYRAYKSILMCCSNCFMPLKVPAKKPKPSTMAKLVKGLDGISIVKNGITVKYISYLAEDYALDIAKRECEKLNKQREREE